MYRILLADDEPIFLEFMRTMIDWQQYHCSIEATAADGDAALSIIREKRPDIVFMDISMPKMDGLEVCKQVRKQELPSRLIIMTGHDEFTFAYQAIKLGIDDFLLKPFSKEELETALQKALPSNRSQQNADGANPLTRFADGSTKYEIMSQMIDEYLYKNFARPDLTLTIISRDLSFENSYLRRVYKVTRGITIMQKLESIRIEEAKRLLRLGTYQGQEISSLTGFSDQYYFSKRFKQVTGMTPTEYRDQ